VPRAALRVVAAALCRRDAAGVSEVLIAQRPSGKWQAGRWEFPGGKIEPGESEEAAVRRELAEELGITVRDVRAVDVFRHDYADRSVEIGLWIVTAFDGEPQGLDEQALRWVTLDELHACDLLEADLPMIGSLHKALQ
jgi:8-oxo-dGTP diphosphatase